MRNGRRARERRSRQPLASAPLRTARRTRVGVSCRQVMMLMSTGSILVACRLSDHSTKKWPRATSREGKCRCIFLPPASIWLAAFKWFGKSFSSTLHFVTCEATRISSHLPPSRRPLHLIFQSSWPFKEGAADGELLLTRRLAGRWSTLLSRTLQFWNGGSSSSNAADSCEFTGRD